MLERNESRKARVGLGDSIWRGLLFVVVSLFSLEEIY